MSDTIDYLESAIKHLQIICVWGDFDVDVQSATEVLTSTRKILVRTLINTFPIELQN
jgi:single-stranded DNA-specific DHH superfamily exonuclease